MSFDNLCDSCQTRNTCHELGCGQGLCAHHSFDKLFDCSDANLVPFPFASKEEYDALDAAQSTQAPDVSKNESDLNISDYRINYDVDAWRRLSGNGRINNLPFGAALAINSLCTEVARLRAQVGQVDHVPDVGKMIERQAVPEWISVDERLHPEKPDLKRYVQIPCLIVRNREVLLRVWNCQHLVWDDEDGDDFYCEASDVTHWMHLPAAPTPEGEE